MKRMKRRVMIGAAVLIVALVLFASVTLLKAQVDGDLGIFFLFDRSGSMSQPVIDGELCHGAETAALLFPPEAAGGGFFGPIFQGLAPLASPPITASVAFTNAQGTTPTGGTNLLEGLNEAEAQLGSWTGEKVILIYGDGCVNDSSLVEEKIAALELAGHTVVYVQMDVGCGHLADDVRLYYTSPPTSEDLLADVRGLVNPPPPTETPTSTPTNTATPTNTPTATPTSTPTNTPTPTPTSAPHEPELSLTILGPDTASVGQTVVISYVVVNTAFTPTGVKATRGDGSLIASIAVTDSVVGPVAYTSGDTNRNRQLELNEAWFFVFSYNIQLTSSGEHRGLASGRDLDGDLVTASSDVHNIKLLIPVTPTRQIYLPLVLRNSQ